MKSSKKRVIMIALVMLIVSLNITASFAAVLKFGSRGNEVVKLQTALNNKGFNCGKVDGIYGLKTEKAVISFQKANYLRIDGIAGQETLNALYSYNQPVSRGSTTLRAERADYSADEVYWLSRIIHAEAEAEPYEGKIAVGNVVLNRVKSASFPNTIWGVIFEYYQGIPQFSPVADGTIYNNPNQESIQAAKDALNGVNLVGESTYFFNPSKAKGTWIIKNKTYVTRIGNHVFYK